MKVRWILVILLWAIPIASFVTCPSDLHSSMDCPVISQFGKVASFFLVLPGWYFGKIVSEMTRSSHEITPSLPLIVIGIGTWMVFLSLIVLYAGRKNSANR